MIWWGIEGFHLTVGNGCRKLGGHGREMILRRDGDSPLVNCESENELQGCMKPMSRNDPGKQWLGRSFAIYGGIARAGICVANVLRMKS